MYNPSLPFNVPLWVFVPTTTTVKGVTKKVYPKDGELIYCSFRTFGGTEKFSNDVLTVENTAVIETWFRPDIKADCLFRTSDGVEYEVLGTPENISMKNQFLRIKIRASKGGA